MPLSFDDLIPQGGQSAAPQAAAPVSGGGLSFNDLIPQQEKAAPMGGDVPVPTTADHFFTNLPKYPGVLAERFADLARRATSGEILPQSANMPGGEQQGDIGAVLNASLLGMPLAPGGPMKTVPFKAPTEAALEASKTARYSDPAITNLQLKPEAGPDVANIIRTDLKGKKLDQFNAKPYYDLADRLEKPRFGDNFTVEDFQTLREDASAVASPANATSVDKRAGPTIRNAIDNYLGNIPDDHVLSGDAAAANDALTKARADFASLKRSEEVSNALGRAENRAPNANSGLGRLDNLTRQQLTPILDKKTGVAKTKGFEDYTPEELSGLQKAIDPGWLQNQARVMKNKLGGGGGAAHTMANVLGFLGASHFGASPEMAAVAGYGLGKVGQGFGSLADRLAYSRVNQLGDLLRSRSALADEMRAGGPQMVPARWPQMLRFGAPMLTGGNSQQ